MGDHNQAAWHMDTLEDYLMRANSYKYKGKISVAETLAFFKGSCLPTEIVLEIADDNLEGFLVWEEFKMAVRIAMRRQQKQLQREKGGVLSPAYDPVKEFKLRKTSILGMNVRIPKSILDRKFDDVPITSPTFVLSSCEPKHCPLLHTTHPSFYK